MSKTFICFICFDLCQEVPRFTPSLYSPALHSSNAAKQNGCPLQCLCRKGSHFPRSLNYRLLILGPAAACYSLLFVYNRQSCGSKPEYGGRGLAHIQSHEVQLSWQPLLLLAFLDHRSSQQQQQQFEVSLSLVQRGLDLCQSHCQLMGPPAIRRERLWDAWLGITSLSVPVHSLCSVN